MEKSFENGRLVPSHSGGLRSHSGYMHRHADRDQFQDWFIMASRGGALNDVSNLRNYLKQKQKEKNVNALSRLIARGKERASKLNSASQVVKLFDKEN